MDALYTAANRIVQRSWSGNGGAAGVDGNTDPSAFGRTGARDVSDAVFACGARRRAGTPWSCYAPAS